MCYDHEIWSSYTQLDTNNVRKPISRIFANWVWGVKYWPTTPDFSWKMHQVSDSLRYPTVHLQHLVFTYGTAKKKLQGILITALE